jgi:hypothetical protein
LGVVAGPACRGILDLGRCQARVGAPSVSEAAVLRHDKDAQGVAEETNDHTASPSTVIANKELRWQ